jgi:hypothetical protein
LLLARNRRQATDAAAPMSPPGGIAAAMVTWNHLARGPSPLTARALGGRDEMGSSASFYCTYCAVDHPDDLRAHDHIIPRRLGAGNFVHRDTCQRVNQGLAHADTHHA